MRDLKECQAEVFRRSEEKIKRRRQRTRQALLICVPLVLCAGAAVALSAAGRGAEKATDAPPVGAGGMMEIIQDSSNFFAPEPGKTEARPQCAMPIMEEPPAGRAVTAEETVALVRGGYNWTRPVGEGLSETVIADQASRPVPKELMEPVYIHSSHGGSIMDGDAPTNSRGYLVELLWEVPPTSVVYTCWPQEIWQGDAPERQVFSQGSSFYAYEGGHVYEIVATWADGSTGCAGTVQYYVWICGGNGQEG